MSRSKNKSRRLFDHARQLLPGGLSRNTVYREPNPDYFDFARGGFVTDLDGVKRMDLTNNMASLIHGHAQPDIVAAVSRQLQRGTAVTMATEAELQLAQLICERVPWFDKIRFMNSGTEAVMAAIKAARAFTGRPAIAKAEGTYHGTYDYAEVSQNSSPDNWGSAEHPASVPVAKGTPLGVLQDVVVFPFNDLPTTLDLLERHRDQLACVLIDLVPQRAGLIPASDQFVSGLRHWTRENQTLLVFDEVISFRMGYAGAAEWFAAEPDLTTLGKIIGGGFPVGAVAGRDEFMSVMDPTRDDLPFPWSGTFSANPITMTAGRVAMELYDRPAIQKINKLGDYARQQVNEVIQALQIPASVTGVGSMFRVHPFESPPVDFRTTWQDATHRRRTQALVDKMYQEGFMLFRTATAALSTAISEQDVDLFANKLRESLAKIFAA